MRRESSKAETLLAQWGRDFYARGWALGTSGNFSIVERRKPIRLTITASGLDKGTLSPDQFVQVDASGRVVRGSGQPSAETALHLVLARARLAGAVLHTHSVWSTIVSDKYAQGHGLWIEGYEMLKGLEGVTSHLHREWLPIIENSQDMATLAVTVEAVLDQYPDVHGFLLRRHGLYTWGTTPEQAKRHIEVLEFLLEVVARTHSTTLDCADKLEGSDGHC